MPRHPRHVVPDVPLHIIQRGNNRAPCFQAGNDYLVYLDLLKNSALLADCKVHAYVLMTNHVHLLASPMYADSAARMMKSLGQCYAQFVNRRYSRTGTLWEGRFRSCLVDDDRYLLVRQRYIELNPVRAGMAAHPSLYAWSSFAHNALGQDSALLTPHSAYTALGRSDAQRLAAYRHLFERPIPERMIARVRHAVNGSSALGDAAFNRKMTRRLGIAVGPRAPGRPRDDKKLQENVV